MHYLQIKICIIILQHKVLYCQCCLSPGLPLCLRLLLGPMSINSIIGGGDWCAKYNILIREKQRGIDGMVREMEFSGDGKKRSVSLGVNFNLNLNLNLR